ncbi:MAG TPA: YjgN family protein [bacterium]|nr:YjgN family protein [bacterium]
MATQIATSASGPAPSSGGRLFFHGDGGTLFGLYVVNLFLTVITLGVYYFWARTRIRTYLLSQTAFEGDRLAWHGTGKELLVGFMKIAVLFVVLYAATTAFRFGWHHPAREFVLSLGGYIIGLILVPIATVGARRYRLSRVSWRGIRFSFRGRAREFIRVFIPGALLTVITSGFYYPFFQNNLRRYLIDHSYFGTAPFSYDGRGRDLFNRFVLTLGLAVAVVGGLWILLLVVGRTPREVTSGLLPQRLWVGVMVGVTILPIVILWFWYAAYRNRYYWAHTSFGGARFRSTVFAGRLMWLTLTNLLLAGVTVGLALPWVLIRTLRFHFANVSLEGPVDLAAIQQDAQAASAVGGALGDALDIGFFDVDLAI